MSHSSVMVAVTREKVDLGELDAVRIDVPANEPELAPIPLQLLVNHAPASASAD